ncbi:helix-turn-helix domain-containing protein [Mesorhizobium sp. M1423]|uniref:helix-turn-helix transcriptional regulator n=1 Tax=Mesorhizobium sp. M1423 TaxID=2957101 RepID=UPI003334F401
MTPAKRLLTTAEAAAYCGLSVPMFKAHVRVAPFKIGSVVRYDVRAIDKWIDGHRPIEKTADEWLALLDTDYAPNSDA